MAKSETPDIPWETIVPEIVKIFTPFAQAIIWLGLTKYDKRVNAMNNLIAIGEVIPAIDLGLPKGVVLGALYDKTGDSMEIIAKLVDALEDIPKDVKDFIDKKEEEVKEAVEETKQDVEEAVKEVFELYPDIDTPAEKNQFISDYRECEQGANDAYYVIGTRSKMAYITSCMIQKGWSSKLLGEYTKRLIE